jgi:xanthine dehydrogenase/oxidase
MDKIQIKPANNFIGNNSFPTGGSIGSELCCFVSYRSQAICFILLSTRLNDLQAAGKACENLLERMKPIREKLKNPTWEELIAECHKLGIELSAFYR